MKRQGFGQKGTKLTAADAAKLSKESAPPGPLRLKLQTKLSTWTRLKKNTPLLPAAVTKSMKMVTLAERISARNRLNPGEVDANEATLRTPPATRLLVPVRWLDSICEHNHVYRSLMGSLTSSARQYH